MFVLTVDQRDSRHTPDRVPDLLADLKDAPGLVRAPERTVGDEVQAIVDSADRAVDLVLHILRLGEWSVGVGAGPVEEPLPASAREGRGAAFVLARAAVEAAKSRTRSVPVAVRGVDPVAAGDAEAVLMLIGAVAARRTSAGWRAIDERQAAETAGREPAGRSAAGREPAGRSAAGREPAGGEPAGGEPAGRSAAGRSTTVPGTPGRSTTAPGTPGRSAAVQETVAARLGISQQAVSERLRTALWAEELAARPAAAHLLTAAAAEGRVAA